MKCIHVAHEWNQQQTLSVLLSQFSNVFLLYLTMR